MSQITRPGEFIAKMFMLLLLLTFILFADDTNIFLKGKHLSELIATFNIELINISDSFAANKLSLNVLKTNSIYFSNGKSKTDIILKLNGKEIKQVRVIKFVVFSLMKN